MNSQPSDDRSDSTALSTTVQRVPAGADVVPYTNTYTADPSTGPMAKVSLPIQLLRYKWTALVVFAAAASIGVAGVWASVAPSYQATAKIEVSPVIPQLIEGKSDMVPLYESYRASQVDHLTGPEVIDAVLDRSEVRNTNFYRGTPATLSEKLLARVGISPDSPPRDRLTAALSATSPKGKQHIYVSISANTPGEARLLVDAVVDEYVRITNRRESDQELDRMTKLRNEIRTREGDLMRINAAAAEHRERLKTGAPERLLEERLLRLDGLIARMQELQREVELDSADSATASADAPKPAAASVEEDAEWQRLSREVDAARAAVEQAPNQYGDLHPTMDRMRKAVEYAELRLKEREAALSGASGGGVEGGGRLARISREADMLKRAIEAEQEQYDAAFKDAEVLRKLDVDSAELMTTLQRLRGELERIEMNRQVAGTIRRWAAYEPTLPSDDKRLKLMGAALAGAAALAIGVAFARVRLNTRVHVAEEVLPYEMNVLGRLPLQVNAFSTSIAVDMDPVAAEALRMLRTSLLSSLHQTGGKVIQLTSAEAGCGKSTLAVRLARSLARLNKRVLLVDADIRRPALSREFGALDRGLLCVLADPQLQGVLVSDPECPTLQIMPAGRCEDLGQAEMLANGALSQLIERWRLEFDFIILDSPPMLGTADAAILARQVDGTILLVREQQCRRRAVTLAIESMRSAGGNILGTVVLGRAGRRESYYTYASDYGTTSNDSTLA